MDATPHIGFVEIGYFEEAPNHKSSNRLMFFIGQCFGLLMGAWVFAWTKDWVAATGTITSICALFGGQKLLQKNMEGKQP